jgi:hypothetical protein
MSGSACSRAAEGVVGMQVRREEERVGVQQGWRRRESSACSRAAKEVVGVQHGSGAGQFGAGSRDGGGRRIGGRGTRDHRRSLASLSPDIAGGGRQAPPENSRAAEIPRACLPLPGLIPFLLTRAWTELDLPRSVPGRLIRFSRWIASL